MKKLIFAFLMLAVFSSCENEDHDVDVNNYNGPEIAYFTDGVESSYFVTPDASAVTIQVGATSVSSSARTYSLTVDPESTAQEGVDFSFVTNTVTIPAGEYFGEFQIQGIFEGTTATGSELIINLVGSGSSPAMTGAKYTLSIFQQCVSDLAGMYNVTTNYGYHDFLPDFNPYTMEVEIVEVGAGEYFVQDFSGGLYTVGPYSSAYGTSETSFDVTFSENCGLISWSGQSDPWGAVVPLDGGVNEVDFQTGVITISWYCEGYGENGVSVYTPL